MTRAPYDPPGKKGRAKQKDRSLPGISGGGTLAGAAPSREVVVKVVGWGKSPRSARAMIEYISENSDHVRPGTEPLHTQTGEQLKTHEAIQALKEWNLKPDRENLSKEAREASPIDRRRMEESAKLDKRQAVHLVISFPKTENPTRRQMIDIAHEAMRPYAEAGYRYAFALHMAPAHKHVHVIMTAVSDYGQRLRIQPKDVQTIRRHVAEAGRRIAGMDLLASTKTANGRALARALAPLPAPVPATIPDKAPMWYARHGAALAIRRASASPRRPPPAPVPAQLPALHPTTAVVLAETFGRMYQAPAEAQQRYLEMMVEASRTARWFLEKQPAVFGPVKDATAFDPAAARAWYGVDWKTEAARSLAAAAAADSPAAVQARLATISAIRDTHDRTNQERAAQLASTTPAPSPAPVSPQIRAPADQARQTPPPTPERIETPDKARQVDQGPPLQRAAPMWYARHGAAWEARRAGAPVPEAANAAPLPTRVDLPPATEAKLANHFAATFTDPAAARGRFLELASENPRAAFYEINNRPHLFGDVKPEAPAAKLTQRDLPIPAPAAETIKAAMVASHRPDQAAAQYALAKELRALPTRPELQRGPHAIHKDAPMWYARHGYDYEARRTEATRAADVAPAARVANVDTLPQANRGHLLEEFRKAYTAPGQAAASFIEMHAENPRAALYTLASNPAAFGALKKDATAPVIDGKALQLPHASREKMLNEMRAAIAADANQARRQSLANALRPLATRIKTPAAAIRQQAARTTAKADHSRRQTYDRSR